VLITGVGLLTTNVDIPLGRGWAPVLSLGGGVGFMYVDPDPDVDVEGDLDAIGLRLEQSVSFFLDTRLRADLCFPIDPSRGAFVALGVARDWASGDVKSRIVDRDTGETVSTARSHHHFDRTTFQLALVFAF